MAGQVQMTDREDGHEMQICMMPVQYVCQYMDQFAIKYFITYYE
jgi:hypothetical protein